MKEIIEYVLQIIGDLGYGGIFFMMFLESSFFPFPSEVAMIPAGYLAYEGRLSASLAFLSGVGGSLAGALLNYWIALRLGRGFILRYGKYVFFSPRSLQKMEEFFLRHGPISTFVGRLIPALRQYISLPAGLCRMPLLSFCVFTSLGAGIWVAILVGIGYSLGAVFGPLDSSQLFSGEAGEWIRAEIRTWLLCALGFLFLLLIIYVFIARRRR